MSLLLFRIGSHDFGEGSGTTGGKNLYNSALNQVGTRVHVGGFITGESGSVCSPFIAVQPNRDYVLSGRTLPGGGACPIVAFDAAHNVIGSCLRPDGVDESGNPNKYILTPANTAYVCFNIAYQNAGTDTAVMFERGQLPSAYEAYSNGGAVYGDPQSPWREKRILVIGDSIYAPFRADQGMFESSYAVERAAKIHGAIVVNEAFPSAFLRTAYANGGPLDPIDKQKAFGLTLAEFNADSAVSAYSYHSYETKLLQRVLEGVDLVLFAMNYNDYTLDSTAFHTNTISSRDRKYWNGSYNNVIDKMLEAKPSQAFAFLSHHNGIERPNLIDAQVQLATYWGKPLCRIDLANPYTWEQIKAMIPDGVHPSLDSSGTYQAMMGNEISRWLYTV